MKRTLILGASGGIGSALARACHATGEEVTTLSRSADGFDMTDPQSIEAALSQLEGPFHRVVVATGALEISGQEPEKTIRTLTQGAMMDHFLLNTIGPALVLSHVAKLLPRKERSMLAVLSARVGSIGDNHLGGWISYRASKAAVNQVVRTAAIELGRSHPQSICVSLHPGTVKTEITQKYSARYPAVDPSRAAENLLHVMDGLTAKDSGGFYDWAGKTVPW